MAFACLLITMTCHIDSYRDTIHSLESNLALYYEDNIVVQ